jgi:hypothetical protein
MPRERRVAQGVEGRWPCQLATTTGRDFPRTRPPRSQGIRREADERGSNARNGSIRPPVTSVTVRRDGERCEEIGKEVAQAVPHAVTLKITRTPYLAACTSRRPIHGGVSKRG